MLILIDQDNTLADFDKRFIELWRFKYPDEFFVLSKDRKNHELSDDYPVNLREKAKDIYRSRGFFVSLQPIAGAIEAVKEMIKLGHDVRICTAPISRYDNCVLEKYLWIEKYLGWEFTKKIILTKDKTIVLGDILIDDKPEITGAHAPQWEHIVFDQPYNRHISDKKRITWENWREVLEI